MSVLVQAAIAILWPLASAALGLAARSRLARWVLWGHGILWCGERLTSWLLRSWLRRIGCDDPLLDLHCSAPGLSEGTLRTIAETSFGATIFLVFSLPAVLALSAILEWRARRRRPADAQAR